MGPLEGIKVLDLTRVLAGPYCTMLLGDLGAEIIKVEVPVKGDDSRHFGPYQNGESAYFMSLNRNKMSMTLNLKTEKGKNLLRNLVKKVDVLVENFRPGTMEKLGLGYDVLKDINPKLIYAASSGFGHTGPYSQRPAYDGVVQAMGGIMSITGAKDGEPTRVGPSIGDISAGLFTTIGILAALNHRHEKGIGQKVDVAMLDCQVAMLENAIARYVVTKEVPKPMGNRHTSIVPFEPFDTQDQKLVIAVGNDQIWQRFCQVAGLEALMTDPRFSTNPERNKNYDVLRPLIAETMLSKPIKTWQTLLDDAGVPNGPINYVDQVMVDEQVLARDMIVDVTHPTAGSLKMPGIAIKLSESPGAIVSPAPVLGQHTDALLKAYFGYDDKDIEALRQEGVL